MSPTAKSSSKNSSPRDAKPLSAQAAAVATLTSTFEKKAKKNTELRKQIEKVEKALDGIDAGSMGPLSGAESSPAISWEG